jgi:hypothetical protein
MQMVRSWRWRPRRWPRCGWRGPGGDASAPTWRPRARPCRGAAVRRCNWRRRWHGASRASACAVSATCWRCRAPASARASASPSCSTWRAPWARSPIRSPVFVFPEALRAGPGTAGPGRGGAGAAVRRAAPDCGAGRLAGGAEWRGARNRVADRPRPRARPPRCRWPSARRCIRRAHRARAQGAAGRAVACRRRRWPCAFARREIEPRGAQPGPVRRRGAAA